MLKILRWQQSQKKASEPRMVNTPMGTTCNAPSLLNIIVLFQPIVLVLLLACACCGGHMQTSLQAKKTLKQYQHAFQFSLAFNFLNTCKREFY